MKTKNWTRREFPLPLGISDIQIKLIGYVISEDLNKSNSIEKEGLESIFDY